MNKLRPSHPGLSLAPEAQTEPELPAAKGVHLECVVLLQRALRDLSPDSDNGRLTVQLIRQYLQELRKKP